MRLKRILIALELFRVLFLVISILLHPAGHTGFSLVDLGLAVDALGAFFLLFFNLTFVHRNGTSNWDLVGSERRALALGVEAFIGIKVAFGFHFSLIAFPKRKWRLTLLSYLNRLLFYAKAAIFVLVLDLLEARDEHSGGDGLASELVSHHALLLHLFLHHHRLDLSLPDSFGLYGFSCVEFEWDWDSDTILAFFL